ncbi:hypothetical protein [Pseudomonas syringae]|uniref:hypothetical protein n=1 Tax=Pseudomonas syringae TaxID=317 RepID=UPI0011D06B6E|nr:hypothetical protein [Pseudomonas syringae]
MSSKFIVWSGWFDSSYAGVEEFFFFDTMKSLSVELDDNVPYKFLCPIEVVDVAFLLKTRVFTNAYFSVITGDSLEACLLKIQNWKSKISSPKHLAIDRLKKGGQIETENSRFIYDGALSDGLGIGALFDGSFGVISISSHGRPDALYPPHSLICGASTQFMGSDHYAGRSRNLACQNGEGCYYGSRRRFNAENLNSTVIFLNSCNSGTLGQGYIDAEVCIDISLLKGTGSIIVASPIIHQANGGHATLFCHLMRAGYNIHEAIHVIEQALMLKQIEQPNLLIFGDGEFSFEPEISVPDALFVYDGNGDIVTTLTNGLISFLSFENSSEYIFSSHHKNVFVDPTHAGILIYSDGSLVTEKVVIDFVSKQSIRECGGRVDRLYKFFPNLISMSLKSGELNNEFNRLISSWDRVDNDIKRLQAGNGGSVVKIKQKIKSVTRHAATLSERLLDKIVSLTSMQAFHITEGYREATTVSEVSMTECFQCRGEAYLYTFNFLSTPYLRYVTQCMFCGVVEDVDSRKEWVKKFDRWPIGNDAIGVRVSTTGINNGALCGIVLLDTARFLDQPVVATSSVNEDMIALELHMPESLPKHHYWAKIYVVDGLNISSIGINLWKRSDGIEV